MNVTPLCASLGPRKDRPTDTDDGEHCTKKRRFEPHWSDTWPTTTSPSTSPPPQFNHRAAALYEACATGNLAAVEWLCTAHGAHAELGCGEQERLSPEMRVAIECFRSVAHRRLLRWLANQYPDALDDRVWGYLR